MYDMATANYSVVANLTHLPTRASSLRFGDKGYIYSPTAGLYSTLELDMESYDMRVVGPANLSTFNFYTPAAVSDEEGRYGYLVGK
jgi:hypothetical protein